MVTGNGRIYPRWVTHAQAVNLATEPSLETVAQWNAHASATIQQVADALFGDYALEVVTPGSGGDEGARQTAFAASPDTAYSASCYVKGAGLLHLNVNELDSGDGYLTTRVGVSKLSVAGDWTRLECLFTTGASAAKIELYVLTDQAQAVRFVIDGVQVEAGDAVSPWGAGTRPAFVGRPGDREQRWYR